MKNKLNVVEMDEGSSTAAIQQQPQQQQFDLSSSAMADSMLSHGTMGSGGALFGGQQTKSSSILRKYIESILQFSYTTQ